MPKMIFLAMGFYFAAFLVQASVDAFTIPCVSGIIGKRRSEFMLHGLFGESMAHEKKLYELSVSTTPNPVVLDVGANVGEFTERVVLPNTPATSVFLFEPLSSVRRTLERRLSRMRRRYPNANLKVLPYAASDGDQKSLPIYAPFNARLHKFKGASLGNMPGTSFKNSRIRQVIVDRITSIKLDNWLHEQNINFVHFAKLDCEGYDLRAMVGMGSVLKAGAVGALYFEYDISYKRTKKGDSLQRAVHYLSSFGYNSYLVGIKMLLPLTGECWEEGMEIWSTSNVLAIRRDSLQERRVVDGYNSFYG